MMVLICVSGGVGGEPKKRQTSFRFLRSLREVLTKHMSGGGLTVDTQVLSVKAMSTNNVLMDVDFSSDEKSTDSP